MTIATGVGSWPGEDFDEAVRTVLGELPDLPHVPELPARGPGATMTGRTLGLLTGLDADLQPAGWRLTGTTGAPALDQRRARSLLAQDLDALEEQGQDLTGRFKVQLAGPWTLAATVERPRGDRVLADHGARRDLAQALAEAVTAHLADLRRRLPGAEELVVQVDEPVLAAVLAGRVPTASGFGRHRTVEPAEASQALAWVLDAVADAGASPWVHTCAADTSLPLLRGAGARGLVVDLALMSAADHDALAQALDDGDTVALGVLPGSDPATPPTDGQATETVERWLGMVGLDPAQVGDRLVLTTTCGLAGASYDWARRATTLLASAAGSLS